MCFKALQSKSKHLSISLYFENYNIITTQIAVHSASDMIDATLKKYSIDIVISRITL